MDNDTVTRMIMDDVRACVASLLPTHDPTHELIQRPVLLALSGGLDSVVLTHMLLRLLPPGTIRLAHVDHQMRDSSTQDAMFCRRLAHQHHLPIDVLHVDVRAGNSAQHQARQARYGALARCALGHGCHAVVTAHHEDDLLETTLIKLQRGTSSASLSASTQTTSPYPIAHHATLRLLRPLLNISRASLERYAERWHLSWVEDPSNATDAYTRNALRHHVMPHWMGTRAARAGARRSLNNLKDEAQALDQWAQTIAAASITTGPHQWSVCLMLASFNNAPRAIRLRLLQRVHHKLGCQRSWSPHVLNTLIDDIQRTDEAPSPITHLPGAIAARDGDTILFERAHKRGKAMALRVASPLLIKMTCDDTTDDTTPTPQALRWFDFLITVRNAQDRREDEAAPTTSTRWSLTTNTALVVRAMRPGETWVRRDGKREKVKETLRAMGVPSSIRWRYPCVTRADDDDIIWIPGRSPNTFLQTTQEDGEGAKDVTFSTT